MAERVLSQRALGRALLARQRLLERSTQPLPRVVEGIGGVQSQYAPSTYLGLWSRMKGLERSTVTEALERRRLIQATLMRVTIHVVSRRDFWPLAVAGREARRTWWLRATRHPDNAARMRAVARRVANLLADGPLRGDEIKQRLGLDTTAWNGVGLWVDLVRVPPSGTWERRRADLYGLATDWVGAEDVDPRSAVDLLVRRYLVGFGPASRKDIESFTGLPRSLVAVALERLPLRRFVDDSGGELLDLPRQPLPDPEIPAPVRFLPTWDATLLVHARRTQILPERFRALVFDPKTPHSSPTFLVDGQVAGTWRYRDDRIIIEPFERLPRGTRRELEDEAERLAAFHA